MFTRLLSSITNSYIVSFLRDLLSGYVENVDSKQLKASLAKGEVSLFDLKLKEDIFDFLSLPITVAIGYVRVLGISIPWRSLASKPTVVTIEDVIIVLKTESAAEWDEQKEIQLKEEYKRKSLEVHDFINLSQQHDKPKSLMWRISASLLASLEVKIKNVHLVLEDTHSCGISRKVVFGAQVKHASLSSSRTNFSSHPTVAGKQNVSCKVAEVQQFGIYLDSYPIEPKSSPFPVSPDEHHKKAFEYLQRVIRYESYLLQPVDGELRIITTKVPVRVGLNECYSPHDEDWIPSGMGNNQSNDPGVSTVLPAIYVGFKFPEAEFRFAYDQLMDLSEIIHYHIYIYGNFYYAIYYRDKDLHGSADEEKEYAVAWTTKIGILADSNGSGNKELLKLEEKVNEFENEYHLDYIMGVRLNALMNLREVNVERDSGGGIMKNIIRVVSPRKNKESLYDNTSATNRLISGGRAVEELREMLGDDVVECRDKVGEGLSLSSWTVDFTLELDLNNSEVRVRFDREGGDEVFVMNCKRLRVLSDTMTDRSWSVSMGCMKPVLTTTLNRVLEEKRNINFNTVFEIEGNERSSTTRSDVFMRFGMAQCKREDMPDVTVRAFTCGRAKLVVIPEVIAVLAVELQLRSRSGDARKEALVESASDRIQKMVKDGLQLARDLARGDYDHRGIDVHLDLGAPVCVLIPRDARADSSDAILIEIGAVSLRSEIREKVSSLQGVHVEDAFDLYDLIACGNRASYLPSCSWAPLKGDYRVVEIWRESGFKVHARICHLPREELLPNAVVLVEHSELEILVTEECLELVIEVLHSAMRELERVEYASNPRECEVSISPTPMTTESIPIAEFIGADIVPSSAYPPVGNFSLWAVFDCPKITLTITTASLSVTSNGQSMTMMSNADGSFDQLWEIGALCGTVSDRDEPYQRVFSTGQPSAVKPHGFVDEFKDSTLNRLQDQLRQRLAIPPNTNTLVRVHGDSPTECDVVLEGISPVVLAIDWPVLHNICKLGTRLSLIAAIVDSLTIQRYRLVGYLDTAEICSSAGVNSWSRWSVNFTDIKCSIWIPLGDYLGSSSPVVLANFNLNYSAVWSCDEPQPLGWYKNVTSAITLTQGTLSLGVARHVSSGTWKLCGTAAHNVVSPFRVQFYSTTRENGISVTTCVEVDPIKFVVSTPDIVIIGAIAEVLMSLWTAVDADCQRVFGGVCMSLDNEENIVPEFDTKSCPPSESSYGVASVKENGTTRLTLKAESLQMEIVESPRVIAFPSGGNPKATLKFAMITVEDLNIEVSTENDYPSLVQNYLADLCMGVDVYNRSLSSYEPCIEPVQLHMALGSDRGGLWRLALNSTWVNILVTESCLESAMRFYYGLVNHLQEFTSTIDENYLKEWGAVSPCEQKSSRVNISAQVPERGPATREFSTGKVLVDRFTSATLLGMSSPVDQADIVIMEPSVGVQPHRAIDWSIASLWQKMMFFKEWNSLTTMEASTVDAVTVRKPVIPQPDSRFDFVRSSAGNEFGPNSNLSCTRRVLPSQQMIPSLWRAMQESGYPPRLARGRYLSLPSLRSTPPSPDSLVSPEGESAHKRLTLADLRKSFSSLEVCGMEREGPRVINLTGLPVLVRTARDAGELVQTGEWQEVMSGCREGLPLQVNDADGSTLPIDLCVQLGRKRIFLERLRLLNQSGSRIHSFRVPYDAFRTASVLKGTPKGLARGLSPPQNADDNESSILSRVRRDWATVRIMVRVELHPTLSLWNVFISSLYAVVNDTSATLVLVRPRRGQWTSLDENELVGASKHTRGTQSSTRAEMSVRNLSTPPHLVLAPGDAEAIPIDWLLPEQCFRSKTRTIGEKKYASPWLGLWDVCKPIIEESLWHGSEYDASWARLEKCLSPLLPSVTLESLARYQSTLMKDYSQLPGSSFEFDAPIEGAVNGKVSLTSTVIAVSSHGRKTRASDLSFEILLEWALQVRNRLCRNVSVRLVPPGLDQDDSAGWVCRDLRPGENVQCPRLMQRLYVQAGEFESEAVDIYFLKRRFNDSVLRLRSRRDKNAPPMYIRIEVATALDPSEVVSLSREGRVRLQSLARFITLYSAYWIVNRLEFPIYLWRVGFGDGLVANRSQLGRFWTHSRTDISTNRDPSKTMRVRAGCLPAVQSSGELSEAFRVDTAASGQVVIPKGERQPAHWLGVNITLSPPPFVRTRIIELVPRFIFVNLTGRQIWIQEESGNHHFCIHPSSRMSFHPQHTDADDKVMVHISCVEPDELAPSRAALGRSAMLASVQRSKATHIGGSLRSWSYPFCISDLGTMQIRHSCKRRSMSDEEKGEFVITEIYTSTPDNATIFIALRAPTAPDFKLHNMYTETVWFRQAGLSELPWEQLEPCTSIEFSWHDPAGRRILQLRFEAEERLRRLVDLRNRNEVTDLVRHKSMRTPGVIEIELARIKVHEKLVTEASETVIIEVVVSGGSRILRMSLLKDAPFGGDAVIRPSARQRAATVAGVVTDAVTRIAGNVMETAATGGRMIRSTVTKPTRLVVPRMGVLKRKRKVEKELGRRKSLRRSRRSHLLAERNGPLSFLRSPSQPGHVIETDSDDYSAVSSYHSDRDGSLIITEQEPQIDKKLEALFDHLDLLERPIPRDLVAVFGERAITGYCNRTFNDTDMFSLKRGEDEIGDEGVSPAELEWALAAHKLTAIKGVNLPCAVQELLVASSTATTVSSAIASQLEEPLNLKTPSVRLSMTVELEGIGLSLIDSTPEELLYASTRHIVLSVKIAGNPSTDSTVQLSIDNVQVDNHVKGGYFKTLLHTKTSNSTRHRAEDLLPISPEPSFQVGVVLMAGNEWRNIREIRSLNVTLQPLVINVDQKSFVRMLRFMMELYSLFEIVPASVARYVASVRTAGETDEQTVLGRSTARTSANSSMVAYHNMLGTPEFDASQRAPADSKVYIQTFTLDPVRVNLSLHTKSSRGRQGGKDDDVALVRLMNAAFENVPKVSNSPMRFKAITNEHSFATPAELASDIASFYVREGMMQFLKIIGSIDVLGNPVTFLNRVGDRIVDLLRDSTDATSRGDSHSLTTSLGRGVKSIGAGVVGGLFDSLSRMTSGLHASADAIIIYLQWIWIGEEELSDRRGCDMTCYEDTIEAARLAQLAITGVGDGIVTGIRLAVIRIYRGSLLAFWHPYGASRHATVVALIPGIITGLLTFALCLISAILLGVASIFRGLRNSVIDKDTEWDSSEHHQQVRPALHTTSWRCLRQYDPDLAVVSRVLRLAGPEHEQGHSQGNDGPIVYSMELQEKSTVRTFVCLTPDSLLKLSTKHGNELERKIPFLAIKSVRVSVMNLQDSAGMKFVLTVSFSSPQLFPAKLETLSDAPILNDVMMGTPAGATDRRPIQKALEEASEYKTIRGSIGSDDYEEVLPVLKEEFAVLGEGPLSGSDESDAIRLRFQNWAEVSSLFDELAQALKKHHAARRLAII